MEDEEESVVVINTTGAGEGDSDEEEILSKYVLPKRPASSFFLFCRDKKDELPSVSMTLLERNHVFSQMWKLATNEEKQVYIDARTVEKERYKNELMALQKRHPNALKILLAKKRAKKKPRKHKPPAKQDKSPPKKRGRKRKRPPSPLPPSTPPLLPPPSVSPISSPPKQSPVQQKVPPSQQVIVPGTDIAIFTTEFLEYNKKLNSQLLQMRKANKDLQFEVSRFEDSISDQEKALNGLQDKLKTFKEESESLERNRQKLEDSIFKSFGSLANERTSCEITSAEQLLDTLLANGVNAKALASAVKSFIAP